MSDINLSTLNLEIFRTEDSNEIVFLSEAPSQSDLLDQVVNEVVEMQPVMNIITREDVVKLLEEENVILPKYVKEYLDSVIEGINECKQECGIICTAFLAQLLKIKIINEMYKKYVASVEMMNKWKKLENDFCLEKNKQKKILNNFDDYTKVPLEPTIIPAKILFYLIKGFNEDIILELLQINVPLSSIIVFDDGQCVCGYFGDVLLENTAFIKCDALNSDKLIDVIKEITIIKQQYSEYQKKIKMLSVEEIYEKKDIRKYNEIIDRYPPECVNILVILDSLLTAICLEEEEEEEELNEAEIKDKITSNKILLEEVEGEEAEKEVSEPEKPKTRCICPIPSYRAHEEDELFVILNSFKSLGRELYDINIKMLKLLQPIALTNNYYTDNYNILLYEHSDMSLGINLLQLNEMKSQQRNSRNIFKFNWNENLQQSVLLQMLSKAETNFAYFDSFYCHETDSSLFVFHDNLNDRGIDIKKPRDLLPTPLCLRDFYIDNIDQIRSVESIEEIEEVCCGASYLKDVEMYKDYQHLLVTVENNEETDETTDADLKGEAIVERNELKNEQGLSVNNDLKGEIVGKIELKKKVATKNDVKREEVVADNSDLSLENDDENLISVYDLGPRLLRIIGTRTIFHTNENLKIVVDNTRFFWDDPNCTLKIIADNNYLIVHTRNEDPFKFHFIFSNESVLLFTKSIDSVFDIVLNLPNNLSLIGFLNSNNDIKQISPKNEEEYRIFSKKGILIKRSDGTTTIFKTNGDVIELGKYRNIIQRFEGLEIIDEGETIVENQKFYAMKEVDFLSEEIGFERDDGLRCVFNREGTLIVQMLDGTMITTWFEIVTAADELIDEEEEEDEPLDMDEWVIIAMNYKYEHPQYLSISYLKDCVEIYLHNNAVVIRKTLNDIFNVDIADNINVVITNEKISFNNNCLININPLYEVYRSQDSFLTAEDSCGKQIKSDFKGNCEFVIPTGYIFNINNENHFIVNRSLSGTILWTNDFVENKLSSAEDNQYCDIINYDKNIIEIYECILQNFDERFVNKIDKICLRKDRIESEIPIRYVTVRNLQRIIFDEGLIAALCGLFPIAAELYANFIEAEVSTSSDDYVYIPPPTVHPELLTKIIDEWRLKCSVLLNMIREKDFPNYFSSVYCTYGKKSKARCKCRK